ncbi:DNA helicase [Corynebacterium phage IME1320_01]|nr:DNA helicase [Corynebacterium phage IME1320_01]
MKYKPYDYQQFTTNFITTHPEAAIFLGMGLGKTIITLTAIKSLILDSFEVTKVLIIAPLRVARDTWPAELEKWDHLADLRMSVMVGDKKTRTAAFNQDADIYVINRENIPWLVDVTWPDWPFDMVIIDELSSFKSHQARRFKALRKCRPKIRRIVGLTGTPAPNSLLDLWAQFALIDGGQRLGKFITHYRDRYFLPDKRNGPQVYSYKLKEGADQEIYNQIADITVSMRTTDYLQLPPLTVTDYPVSMSKTEETKYKQLKKDMVLELEDGDVIDAPTAAALAGKLQQASSGAIYTDDEIGYRELHGRKLDALEDIIESANGEPVLIAYWFKHEVPRILQRLPRAVPLNSSQDFRAWNRGEIPIGLIHPASAGHGLNLQDGGHLLVWLTMPWSLELVEQTNARLFRQGQKQPVTITRITCAGTIDQQVTVALEAKNSTQTALVEAVAAELKGNQ